MLTEAKIPHHFWDSNKLVGDLSSLELMSIAGSVFLLFCSTSAAVSSSRLNSALSCCGFIYRKWVTDAPERSAADFGGEKQKIQSHRASWRWMCAQVDISDLHMVQNWIQVQLQEVMEPKPQVKNKAVITVWSTSFRVIVGVSAASLNLWRRIGHMV